MNQLLNLLKHCPRNIPETDRGYICTFGSLTSECESAQIEVLETLSEDEIDSLLARHYTCKNKHSGDSDDRPDKLSKSIY